MAEIEEMAALTGARLDHVNGCDNLIPTEKPVELAQLVACWLTDKGLRLNWYGTEKLFTSFTGENQ